MGSSEFEVQDNVFSDRTPTVVGKKAVYIRPNLHEFLVEVSKIACQMVIWSSMLKKTVEPIASFLFQNSKPPFDILGQEKCRTVETLKDKILVQEGNPFKLLFLKVLGEQLFSDPDDPLSFNMENMILIDDSPQKGVLNENGNGLFLKSWTRHQRHDKVLLECLAPWLKRLHEECLPGCLRQYVNANRIGVSPVTATSYRGMELFDGLKESAKNMGSKFFLPGLDLAIEPEKHRKK